MNNRIVRIGLAAVAVAVLAFIGINLLAGRGNGAQLTPSSALAQSLGNTTPDPFVGTWQMHNSDPGYNGLRLVISKPDGQYWVLSDSPGLTQYTWEAFTRQGGQLSGFYHVVNPITGKLNGAERVQLTVAKVPGQLLYRYDGSTAVWKPWHATMTKVSDSTATPTPVPDVPKANGPQDPFVGTWRMSTGDSRLQGERFVISKHDGQYTLLESWRGTTTPYAWEVVTRQGDQLSADVPLGNPYRKGRLVDVRWVRLSVTEVPGQLLERYDGTDLRGSWQATMTKVSDSTATPTPAP